MCHIDINKVYLQRESEDKGPVLLELLPLEKVLNAVKYLCAYYLF